LYKLHLADGFRLAERVRRAGKWNAGWDRFFAALRELDLAQQRRNDFASRATTKWLLREARRAEVDPDEIDGGWIARDEAEVCLRPDGTTDEDESHVEADCRDTPFAVYSMRIPRVPPLRVHQLGDISDEALSPNTVEEFEAMLATVPKAISRIHRTIDFMFGTGYMELYRVYEVMEPDYVLYREENARTGSYVRSSDGALRIIPDGRGGSYYTLLLTADTVFEPSFVGDKRVRETVRALTIFRQYVRLRAESRGKDEITRAAVAAGEKEFEESQQGAKDSSLVSFFENL
ncbi:MAG: hypothetical protein K8I02_06765, partial [Candidatus Methylomirabilis sp.]|nr:hypothetical protein [Deltaproteobacteria bacterium]